MRRIKAAVMILGAVGYAMTAGAVGLPFSDNFGTGPDMVYSTNTWTFGTSTGMVTNVVSTYGRSLYTAESAKIPIDAGISNLWFTCYTKMSPIATNNMPEIDTNAAAFFLGTDGKIWAWSSNAYIDVKSNVDSNLWHGFSVQLDFGARKWNIYYKATNSLASDPFTRLNTSSALMFNTNHSGPQATMIEITGPTFLDDVNALISAATVSGSSPTNIYPRTVNYSNTNQWYPSRVADKTYGVGETNLAGQLGADLAAGLVPGDRVRVYTSNGWQEYELGVDGLWDLKSGVTVPGDMTLTAGQPVWFQFATPVEDRFALYDPKWAPEVLASQSTQPASLSIHASTTANGWTSLPWDSQATRTIYPANQATFPTDLAAGSVIFVVNSNGQYTRGYWTGSAWSTIGGRPITLRPGDVVWVYNKGAATTWNVTY